MKKPVTVVAMPVYTPKDYPLIRQLPGADDMPSTWEAWAELFEASMGEREWGGRYGYQRVRIRPDLFKTWLDTNSRVASADSRQRYAQELRDVRDARITAQTEEQRAREMATRLTAKTSARALPWGRKMRIILASLGLLVLLFVGGLLATSTGVLIRKMLATAIFAAISLESGRSRRQATR
ncbi:hypothetical protein ACWGTI_10465 [Mesorhizobium sp. ArgA1]